MLYFEKKKNNSKKITIHGINLRDYCLIEVANYILNFLNDNFFVNNMFDLQMWYLKFYLLRLCMFMMLNVN